MRVRPLFNPHLLVHSIKFWAIEILALIIFLNWAGRALWHELGLDHPPPPVAIELIERAPNSRRQ